MCSDHNGVKNLVLLSNIYTINIFPLPIKIRLTTNYIEETIFSLKIAITFFQITLKAKF